MKYQYYLEMAKNLKTITSSFQIDDDKAKEVMKIISKKPSSDKDAQSKMSTLNKLVGGHGTEVIRSDDAPNDSFWQDAIAEYINTGDTYKATIIYDRIKDKFEVTTVGDKVEEFEKDGLEVK